MVPDVLLRPLRSPGQPGQQGLERGTGCWPRQEAREDLGQVSSISDQGRRPDRWALSHVVRAVWGASAWGTWPPPGPAFAILLGWPP